MVKVKPEDVVQGVGLARKILGWLTDMSSALPLPAGLKRILGIGRQAGLWNKGQGAFGGGFSDGPPR